MSVPEGLPGPKFNAFTSVVLCVHYSRAWRFPDFVLFAPAKDVGRGGALRAPVTRELWGSLVTFVSSLLYFACSGRMKVYGICVEWGLGSESTTCRGVRLVGVCRVVEISGESRYV